MAGWGGRARQILGIRLGRLHQHAPMPHSVVSAPPATLDGDAPAFALVTPSFNQARFIGATLDSVRAQNYPALQYVVQDACSADGTHRVLAERGRGFDVQIEPDAGQADAINRGFARTTAALMGWLNSDDLLLPGTLAFVAAYFAEHPDVDVVYGNRLVIDADGREIGRWILPGHDAQVLRFVDYVPQESLFWRRSAWDRAGGRLDASLHFALDWDLLLRFLDAGCVIHHVPRLFGAFRVHQDQKTQAQLAARGASEMRALRRAQGGRLPALPRRLALHARFLWRHRRADAQFARSGSLRSARPPTP
jgi:cellulose synthase/poly-beta-1,6-N-acetylglucosamine synthase-like glycosyltransferase